VMIFNAEDSAASTIVSRLRAHNADMSRIHLVDYTTITEGDDEGLVLPDFVRDLQLFEAQMAQIKPALVIIDPLTTFLGSKTDTWRAQAVQHALTPLCKVAQKYGTAMMGIIHTNKGGAGKKAIHRFMDSVSIPGVARTAFLVVLDPDDPQGERRALLSAKNNLDKGKPKLFYRIEAGRLVWDLPSDERTVDEILDGVAEGGALIEATEFLTTELSAGPQLAKHVVKTAREIGIAERTLNRAKQKLAVKSYKAAGFAGPWTWALKNWKAPSPQVAPPEDLDRLIE
jgi:hypothetical protein